MEKPNVEQLIEVFAHRQLMQVLQAGSSVGFSPVTVAASMMQMSASLLVSVSPICTAAVLRGYADVIEAGPLQTPARDAAIARFMEAGQALVTAAMAARDFPAPQGRA